MADDTTQTRIAPSTAQTQRPSSLSAEQAEQQRMIDQYVAAHNAFIEEYGSLADDLAKL